MSQANLYVSCGSRFSKMVEPGFITGCAAFRVCLLRFCIAWGLTLALAAAVGADESKCAHCGDESGCQRVCRLMSEDRKVTTTCWGYQCEEFCVPGPSKRGCQHCEKVCGECQDADSKVHVKAHRLVWSDWNPACFANRFTKAKLMKKTESKKVQGYKWVVEDICSACVSRCAMMEPPADSAEIPPLPAERGLVLAPAAIIASLEAAGDRETAQASDAASSGPGVLK
jgi:hypothetical protein